MRSLSSTHRFLLFLSLLLLTTTLPAQDYLGNDRAHFDRKTEHFQRWLDAKGLADFLRIDTVRLAEAGYELELWLNMNTTDPDAAAFLWKSLEKTYAEAEPSQDIFDLLFHTFVRFMEVPAAQANVQIYVPRSLERDLGYSPCFKIWIWEEDGAIQKDRELNGCKARENVEFPVTIRTVDAASSSTQVTVRSEQDIRAVFDRILAFARTKYQRDRLPGDCHDRDPRVREVNVRGHRLEFVVTDLCREVLTEERSSLWCSVVDLVWGPCNDMRRERLVFTVDYTPTGQGYRLDFDVTGKYGAGDYVPRDNDYLDMAPDFEKEYLVPYLRAFKEELRGRLERG